ncbi:MAG TPA: anaerobic ribonucleoside-triphosphate reductase activating protein [Candidatus Anaerobiospirillum pullistercoris]|uniref:Anaerobic ribonucleoside-triphosphate reductase-activating protein n=1 Tax=Candidatus Anaerobiospirillum pullistercoris TaxID=2838452 RepID=A0A9D1WDH8_9GAMM|nr:anaerobic ribonucleoside-triphosphate reductase activating protein [Candidatus Anaerobiospirillum pullistercoris]
MSETQDLSILDNTTLRIAGVVSESIVDGPGIRYTIFTQGCPFHCKGCHNPQAQPLKGGADVPLRTFYDEIHANPLVSGVTFSGGEPFIQCRSLAVLAKILRAEGYSVWSYSGYTYDKLVNDDIRHSLLEQLDVVVDGPFVQSKTSLDIDFRGSTNQRIIDVQKSLQQDQVVLAEGFK